MKALSGSAIKSWFQYRCQRKLRYELSSDDELAAIPIVKNQREQMWSRLGIDFEDRVVRRLHREHGVLQPAPGDFGLSESLAIAFFRGQRTETFAAQINLRPRKLPAFLQVAGVELKRTYPDLVRVDRTSEFPVFTVIDVKATRHATAFHKTQVAFYVRVLESLLAELQVNAQIDPFGEIWRIPNDGTAEGDMSSSERFALGPYLRLVDEFCREVLPQAAATRVDHTTDETFFHVYFKCEQCAFLEHCRKAVSDEVPAQRRDVSAVPGLSHESKQALHRLNIRTVASLAGAKGLGQAANIGWSLSRRAELLSTRAETMVSGTMARTQQEHTFLMPSKADVVFLLSADHDPIDDRLAAVGYRRVEGNDVKREIIGVPASASTEDEAKTLIEVLGALVGDLGDLDTANANAGDAGRHAHIFFYEPAEAVNLQGAVGRHLDNPVIRTGLIQLVRLFPPEEVVPEPEFRGVHHLPGTALRSVMEQLYALPVTVSYDLRQVSAAVVAAGGVGPAYQPHKEFARPFSSLLSIDVIRKLRENNAESPLRERIREDVQGRLAAVQGLVAWLFRKNKEAESPILRLAKKPFRFQSTFDPLNAGDLDVLVACELLENRAGLLNSLIDLAQPIRQRRDVGRCAAGLKLTRSWSTGGRQFLLFSVPVESREADIGPGDLSLILSNDSPDLRLDPAMWTQLRCSVLPPQPGFEDRRDGLLVAMNKRLFDGAAMQDLLRNTPDGGWCLDKTFQDVNTDRAVRFLRGLVENDAS